MDTMMKTKSTFGEFLHSKRKEHLYTVREFARELEIRPSELCDYEYDRALPSDSQLLRRMSDLLELSSDDDHKFYELAGIALVGADMNQ